MVVESSNMGVYMIWFKHPEMGLVQNIYSTVFTIPGGNRYKVNPGVLGSAVVSL
jgi:hypothetical protein